MLVGYIRAGTAHAFYEQLACLKKAGVEDTSIDIGSGLDRSRSGLASCLSALRRGDTLLALDADRLSRAIDHLLEIVSDLAARGVAVGFVDEAGHAEPALVTTPLESLGGKPRGTPPRGRGRGRRPTLH